MLRRVAATLIATFALLACGDDDTTTITVFAAASLTDAFAEVGEAFEAEHPDVSVDFSFAGSSSLREQILDGAPADVYASANQSTMDQLIAAGEVDRARTFATNSLQIVVPAGNPAAVAGLDAFGDDSLLIGLCAEDVPCGDLGRRVLAAAGIAPAPDTDEADVRALLTKIAADELDAGLVYTTDVIAQGDAVEGIDIPDEFDVVATYPIGTVTASSHPDVAAAFIDFVLSDAGQTILDSYGFARP